MADTVYCQRYKHSRVEEGVLPAIYITGKRWLKTCCQLYNCRRHNEVEKDVLSAIKVDYLEWNKVDCLLYNFSRTQEGVLSALWLQ
jgi:hypothetical protein